MWSIVKTRAAVIFTALLGVLLGLPVSVFIWDRLYPPPRCDGGRLPDGSIVIPLCVSQPPPLWFIAFVTLVTSILVVAIYRVLQLLHGRTPASAAGS